MSTAKTENYTPEMVTKMRELYKPEDSQETRDSAVLELVESFGKNKRSIRSKLSSLGIYVAMEKVSKVTGKPAAKKEALAAELVEISGLNLVSAEKLNKTDLQLFINFFNDLATQDDVDDIEAEMAEAEEFEETVVSEGETETS